MDLLGDSHCDEEAARLLPWFVSGRLSATDTERVARHLEGCAVCRRDLGYEREVRAQLKTAASVDYAPQAGLAKVLARIDETEREAPRPAQAAQDPSPPRARRIGAVQWLAAAVVVQALGLGVLSAGLIQRSTPQGAQASYHTLSAPAALPGSGPHLRAVFAPGMTVAQLQTLLASEHLTLVAGPGSAGAYTLGFTDGGAEHAPVDLVIAALRKSPQVLFVEPAVNGEALRP